jgi:hypothetical protein
MKKAFAIVAVICLASAVSYGDLVAAFTVARDNANDTLAPTQCWGSASNKRHAKDKQETTWYGDWTEQDLQEVKALITGPTPTPGYWWEVTLCFVGVTWDNPNPNLTAIVETLDTTNDWNEGVNGLLTGACDSFADGVTATPWADVVAGPVNSFWNLNPALVNSQMLLGHVPAVDPSTVCCDYGNHVQLDMPLVMHLIDDPNCRGLRTWSEGWFNEQVYHLGQWGTSAAAKLCVYEVPEPATMLLIAVGGAGLLLRRKR